MEILFPIIFARILSGVYASNQVYQYQAISMISHLQADIKKTVDEKQQLKIKR